MSEEKLKVFIGSGEASRLERKTLIYSLKKHSTIPLDIHVFNGTHDALEHEGDEPKKLDLPLSIKYQNITEFSSYRYLIPELAGFKGRAVWFDSDMICLKDPRELLECDMGGNDFLAKGGAYKEEISWGLSVMLIDCDRCKFDIVNIFDEISAGKYEYRDFTIMADGFTKHHSYKIGKLDPRWNEFDRYDEETRLIHYTDLSTQPWKFPGHPAGELWFEYFNEACESGAITEEDVALTVERAYVRQNISLGNSPVMGIKPSIKMLLRSMLARISG